MSNGDDDNAHAGDEQIEQAPESMQAAPQFDEDTLDVDPLEQGREPPEGWSAIERQEGYPEEGETLDQRLAQERDDVQP